jgi:hypothetical protein
VLTVLKTVADFGIYSYKYFTQTCNYKKTIVIPEKQDILILLISNLLQ